MGYYWLSFCDPDKPEGTQFLGASIIEAADFVTAITKSHLLGCNPGGEVVTWEFEPDKCPIPIAAIENKLMTKDDIERLFHD